MKKILYLLIFIPYLLFSQTHSIDNKNLFMSGLSTDEDVSINTYFNTTMDSCDISWTIIKDSVPNLWGMSFCFPNCYIEGVTNGQDNFLPNEQHYLNCHVYPYGQSGSGVIQMEITTNNTYKDTVTWNVSINSITNTLENLSNNHLNIYKTINILGYRSEKNNQILFDLHNDGSVKKRLIINSF